MGGATTASEVWRARATFWNTASTKRDQKEALIRYGEPALDKAFQEETADTMREVERRLQQQAQACGIRTA